MTRYDYKIASARENELYRLRKLLSDNNISWAVIEVGHSHIVAFMISEFISIYKMPLGYRLKVTKFKPHLNLFEFNSYGWQLVELIEIFKLKL